MLPNACLSSLPIVIDGSLNRSPTSTRPVAIPARATIGTPSGVCRRLTAVTASSAARTARSGSSSCATGKQKYATMPSPWNCVTCPPYPQNGLCTSIAIAVQRFEEVLRI